MCDENRKLARDHFESYKYHGPLVASYRTDEGEYLVLARPGYGLGHRMSSVVNTAEEYNTVVDFVQSLIKTFTMDDLLVKSFEVFEGEVC